MSDVFVRHRNDILWLTLSRPPHNAINALLLEQLAAPLDQVIQRVQRADSPNTYRLVVLTSASEETFSAGIDLPEDTEAQRSLLYLDAQKVENAFVTLQNLHIPTVALVCGRAFGAGCELASLCNTIIASEDATFRLPTHAKKLFPTATSHTIPALIGMEHTERFMQSGEIIAAHEALRIGLAGQVLSPRRFQSDTEQLLTMLSSSS